MIKNNNKTVYIKFTALLIQHNIRYQNKGTATHEQYDYNILYGLQQTILEATQFTI